MASEPEELGSKNNRLEDCSFDYKEKIDESFGKILCAYANTGGGSIVLGVSKHGKATGISQKDEESATNIAENCKPPVKFASKWEERDGKNVLTIDVPKSDRIHTWKGIAYKRVGSSSFPMGVDEIIELSRRRGDIRFDDEICEEAIIDDIDENKIRWFLHRAKTERNYPLDEKTPVDDILLHLHLLKGNGLTKSAIILFGRDPQKFFPQAEIKCLQLAGAEITKPFPSYHIYSGNLFEQIDKAIEFVLGAIKFPVAQPIGERDFEIPKFVIQEAIVNAAAHRDYHSTAGVQVMVFVDRVEIWNPGGLPRGVTIQSLSRSHSSIPRNPRIFTPLYLTAYAQEAGSGTLEMIGQCKKKGLPEPEFREDDSSFVTVMWRDKFTEDYLKRLGLNERQVNAVMFVKEKGKITNKEYQAITNATKKTASRDLNDLVGKGTFDRIGTTGKGTFYTIKGT